jgi:hypothetical protein
VEARKTIVRPCDEVKCSVDDPGPRQFGEVRVEVQRSTVDPYERSKADPEEAITESIERLAAARESPKGGPLLGAPRGCLTPLASSWPHLMRFNASPCSRSSRPSSRSIARVPPW